jgi:hypothetical protein
VHCTGNEGLGAPSFAFSRISYYAAPFGTTCAAFIEESRTNFADPTKLDRKSGAVERSAIRFKP